MNLDVVANVLPFLFSIFIIVGLTRFIWIRRKTRGALPLTYAALAQLWWITGYIFELLGDNLALKLFFDDIQWIGTVALPLTFLAFVTEYLDLKVKPWVWRGLISVAITFLAMVFTNRWHEWIYHSARYLDREPFSIITYDYGPGVWFIYIFNYLIVAYCAVVMTEKALTANRLQRRQLGLFLLALVVGMVGGILSIYDVFGTIQRDLSPYYFILTDLIIIWALFRYSALDLIPIARSKSLKVSLIL
ncbi:MAG: hypothetical protein L0154_25390 [Chloroflexi bacterium]|nr:hypothetical protein [Chloroflexota bacterium]